MMSDETTTETPGASEAESGAPSLEEQLAAREAEIAELKDRVLRAHAETENVRRRLERDKADAQAYAMTHFARDLLSVADNLRRAVAALPAEAHDLTDAIKAGIEATERELHAVLGRHGVAKIEASGKMDPNFHQPMLEVESEHHEPGAIIAELQTGYTLKDRLLRPALVSVAKPKASE